MHLYQVEVLLADELDFAIFGFFVDQEPVDGARNQASDVREVV